MPLNIVLIAPEIPNNTGNIGRLAVATGSHLHLVKPLGFALDDKRVKRAGLDYWPFLDLTIYEDIPTFFSEHGQSPMALFSSHAVTPHWEIPYTEDHFLVFGSESVGLPEAITKAHSKHCYKIPMFSTDVRSLNLANAVAITTYEGLRQLG